MPQINPEYLVLQKIEASDHPVFQSTNCRKVTLQFCDEFRIPVMTFSCFVDVSDLDTERSIELVAQRHFARLIAE